MTTKRPEDDNKEVQVVYVESSPGSRTAKGCLKEVMLSGISLILAFWLVGSCATQGM
jgi:hypothetical protein